MSAKSGNPQFRAASSARHEACAGTREALDLRDLSGADSAANGNRSPCHRLLHGENNG